MPYATDNYQIDAVAAEAAKRAHEQNGKVIVLPCIPFGVNTGQPDIRLDMNLNHSTQMAILRDIIEVLDRQGIYKLIVLNGHGGNTFKPLLRQLGLEFPNMFLLTSNFFQVANKSEIFDEEGDHADEMETSLMLHLHPDLVSDLNQAGNGTEKKSKITGIREGWAWSERRWSMVTEDTGIGNPKNATAEKGKAYFVAVCEKLAGLFIEVSEIEIQDRYES